MAEETKTPEAERDASAGAAAAETDRGRLEAEIAELKDRLLRAAAEMENLRRRSEREIADTRQYAVSGFARDMLNVADNLRRALSSVPEGLPEGSADPIGLFVEGVALTERELAKVLSKFGIREIEAKGKKFDPNLHQAMFEVPDPELPSGTVVEVVQAGYTLGERTLRPAMVGVSKGGAKPAKDPVKDAPKEGAEPGASGAA
ncbi:nucleotide exchange factor GrpE [Prosthecomicrobium pneumaticum]|uniref:Protein GrpE n=1 Tax=Prosthecomicrobium pneumaticum TaxID=81895 RepID=A0A7W9FNR0_9HYPH|nr:nucleotide exchange factor GrpE [Prosthecomicrobium pneumaticum]MBB5754084.1 molecular chaperone GrpE [Prosthecomicrobium pneumaticum]